MVWTETFHFRTFLYYFTESICSSYLRFWNKGMLLAASADFIKSGKLAWNTDMMGSDETPGKCLFAFFLDSFQKMQKCPQITASS